MGIDSGYGVGSLKTGVCTSATRPAVPFEGQMIYETNTDMVAIWNGTAWRYIAATTPTNGSVLQVQSTTKTDTFSTASTSFVDVTGLSVSITPTSSTSKIFVQVTAPVGQSANIVNMRLLRGSTAIAVADASGTRPLGFAGSDSSASSQSFVLSTNFLDSPATTSATTYKLQVATNTSTIYVNRTSRDSDGLDGRFTSTITVMEIAG